MHIYIYLYVYTIQGFDLYARSSPGLDGGLSWTFPKPKPYTSLNPASTLNARQLPLLNQGP